jgi:hypothetical protein
MEIKSKLKFENYLSIIFLHFLKKIIVFFFYF